MRAEKRPPTTECACGSPAQRDRAPIFRRARRPETFAFLGFTHYCGKTRDGRFIVKHKTQSKPAGSERVPPASSAHLVQLPPAAKPEEPANGLGLVRRPDVALALAPASNHSPLDITCGLTRVTSGKPGAGNPHARIREGEAEWPSYSTTTLGECAQEAVRGGSRDILVDRT
jgi:hypothetical protein